MDIEKMLHEEIANELDELRGLEVGSDQYKAVVDGVTKLADRAIEIDKLNAEHDERVKARESEERDRKTKNWLTGVSTVGGMALTVWGCLKSWKFEETGVVTSAAGRRFIDSLFKRK